ncbi:hypothetical protein F4815DRAFT_295843 [Daldinia loculata]|nr:hypothetical protein F4815DRAFT_295843 [Daldinia loculata]
MKKPHAQTCVLIIFFTWRFLVSWNQCFSTFLKPLFEVHPYLLPTLLGILIGAASCNTNGSVCKLCCVTCVAYQMSVSLTPL